MPENLPPTSGSGRPNRLIETGTLSDGGLVPADQAYWRQALGWKCRLQGKENLFAIGGFPQVSLAEARAAREKACLGRKASTPPMSGSRSSSAT